MVGEGKRRVEGGGEEGRRGEKGYRGYYLRRCGNRYSHEKMFRLDRIANSLIAKCGIREMCVWDREGEGSWRAGRLRGAGGLGDWIMDESRPGVGS